MNYNGAAGFEFGEDRSKVDPNVLRGKGQQHPH